MSFTPREYPTDRIPHGQNTVHPAPAKRARMSHSGCTQRSPSLSTQAASAAAAAAHAALPSLSDDPPSLSLPSHNPSATLAVRKPLVKTPQPLSQSESLSSKPLRHSSSATLATLHALLPCNPPVPPPRSPAPVPPPHRATTASACSGHRASATRSSSSALTCPQARSAWIFPTARSIDSTHDR